MTVAEMGLEPEGAFALLLQEIRSSNAEVKELIRGEIATLKRDYIDRLADDQRRLWDAVHVLQAREYERKGGSRTWNAIWSFISALIGAVAGLGSSSFFTRGH